MLEPREADIPVLFLVLVVFPLVTYILLGKWNETSKKKARISMLAQLAAEEALRVESLSSADVIPTLPSSKTVIYECTRCSAPATTRCSRCKSVRYCSGKCQIIHWRQGHKQECQQWQGGSMNLYAGLSSVADNVQLRSSLDNSNQFLENDIAEPLHSDILFDLPNDPSIMTIDSSQASAYERKLSHSGRRVCNKLRREAFHRDDNIACAVDESDIWRADTELSLRDAPLEHKFGTGNSSPSNEIHRNEERSEKIYGHASTVQRNIMRQSHKLTDETNNVLKPSSSLGIPALSILDKNMTKECETGSEFSSNRIDFQGRQFSCASETLGLGTSAENTSVRGGVIYKKPPYVLRPTTSFSQKRTEEASRKYPSQEIERNADTRNESRASQMNVSTNIHSQGCKGTLNTGGMKMEGSGKSSKITKRNLLGLIRDNNKTKVLFSFEDLVKFFQCEVLGISPRGLLNCGNSCYANAVLQCLSCTKPLIVYLLQRSHSRICWARDWCLMCELEQHVSMLREGGGPLSPSRILVNINIGCRMGGGKQEDAHEFLRLLIMSMQSICLEGMGGEKEVDPWLQETTLIQQIFGGRLRSKVKCLRCHLESERYENIMDLTLEIHGWVESLEDALTQFTTPEDLDGENMYRCGRCSKYVKARKQLSVHEVPNILTIVLKRFQTGEYGKINKCVTFPDMLDMIPFVTGTADIPPLYTLYAVVVHLDTLNASFSGHYVSYVKDLQGTWFRINDSEVQVVPLSQVMSEGAYMLFYSRSFPRPPRVYTEKAPLRAPRPATHAAYKTPKCSKHEQEQQSGAMFASDNYTNGGASLRPESRHGIRDQTPEYIVRSMSGRAEAFADSVSTDFSDATSSDWSLFTSSDESSFTTESTRDSFSTVDYGDAGSLDTISSIFSPFYPPEYSHGNTVSCTKSSPCMPQTRFLSESKGFVLDSSMLTRKVGDVHTGRHPEQASIPSIETSASTTNTSLYRRCGINPDDDFVQTSGYCDL